MKLLGFIFFIALVGPLKAQVKPVKFEQLAALQEREERLVLVLIETDWCKYCQSMKQIIINDKTVGEMLKSKFYTVFLNAEDQSDIVFAGRRFVFKPTGMNTGVHQLAEQLGSINGRLSFPSVCVLNKKNEIIYQYAGFLNASSLLYFLKTLSAD